MPYYSARIYLNRNKHKLFMVHLFLNFLSDVIYNSGVSVIMCSLLIIATLQHQTQSSTGNKHWLTWLGLLRIAVRLKCVDCWTVPTLAPQRSCPLALWASRGRSVADILQKMSRVRIIWRNPRSEVIATVRAFEMTRMSLKNILGSS